MGDFKDCLETIRAYSGDIEERELHVSCIKCRHDQTLYCKHCWCYDKNNRDALHNFTDEELPKILKLNKYYNPKKETKMQPMLDREKIDMINRILDESKILFLSKEPSDDFKLDSISDTFGLMDGTLSLDHDNEVIKVTEEEKEGYGHNYSSHHTEAIHKFLNQEKIKSILISDTKDLSFDTLILECDEMLDIESGIKERFEKWKKGDKLDKLKSKYVIVEKFKDFVVRLPVWMFTVSLILFVISFFNTEGIGKIPWFIATSIANITFIFLTKNSIKKPNITENKSEIVNINHNRTDDELKLIFLKESFVGTIHNLNTKLDSIKQIITDQQKKHKDDKEEILRYKDMFDNTEIIIAKIDRSVKNLDESYEKISEKKAKLNAALDEYIGVNGYISRKEKELNDLKIAHELSARMEANFNETLNITKSVDVLTETIIPGIKQLMSYKIPELIEKVNLETDTERIFLNEKVSIIG
jgi:hypothetical protein